MKIGIYVGSFNPFHKGHYDILKKAEQIFDSVVLVRGVNPEKEDSTWELPQIISNREIITLEKLDLITKPVKKYIDEGHNVTLVRGLRNSTDLQAEIDYYRVLQDIMPDIQVVSIFCDRQLEYVSSKLVRTMFRYKDETYKKYLVD